MRAIIFDLKAAFRIYIFVHIVLGNVAFEPLSAELVLALENEDSGSFRLCARQ